MTKSMEKETTAKSRFENRKTISLTRFDYTNLRCRDIGVVEGKSDSAVIEEVLMGMRPPIAPTFPGNEYLRDIILDAYCAENAVSDTLLRLVQTHSLHRLPPSRVTSLLTYLAQSIWTPEEGVCCPNNETFCAVAATIVEALEAEHETFPDKPGIHTALMSGQIITTAKGDADPQFYISFLVDAIPFLKDWQPVYWMLGALIKNAKIPNTPQNRYHLIYAIERLFA